MVNYLDKLIEYNVIYIFTYLFINYYKLVNAQWSIIFTILWINKNRL